MTRFENYRISIYAKPSTNKSVAICINVCVNSVRWRKSTGIIIPKDCFNKRTKRIVAGAGLSKDNADLYNSQLLNIERKADTIAMELSSKNKLNSINSFIEKFERPEASGLDEFLEIHFEHSSYSENTKGQYRRTVLMLNQLFSNPPSVYDLEAVAKPFEKLMVNQNLSFNTRQKYHSKVKSLINSATQMGYPIINPYKTFKIFKINGFRQFLEIDELNNLIEIYNNDLLPDHLNNVLELFLFSCFTGLRFSDVTTLTHKNIVGTALHFYPTKNRRFSQFLQIPLPQIALDLIEDRVGKLFSPISNTNANVYLKEIMALAGISKHISFHCARHTFGTLFIALGGEILVLKSLMGHSKLDTTAEYVKLAKGLKKSQIKLFDEKFKVITNGRIRMERGLSF